jgi:hypothetical protein
MVKLVRVLLREEDAKLQEEEMIPRGPNEYINTV